MASSDSTTISGLTELTAGNLKGADVVAIDDASAGETKKVQLSSLGVTTQGAQIERASSGESGTPIALTGSGSGFVDVTMESDNASNNVITSDYTTADITLPADVGVYMATYQCGLYRSSGSGAVTATARLELDGVTIPGSVTMINTSGSSDKHSQGATCIFTSTGANLVSLKASSSVELTVDAAHLCVVRLSTTA